MAIDIIQEATDLLKRTSEYEYYERWKNIRDRRFCNVEGGQWESYQQNLELIRDPNTQDGNAYYQTWFHLRPKLECNKVRQSIKRIVSEYRNNKISVRFSPNNKYVSDKVSDICNELFRADEQYSDAAEAKDNAFEEAITGGYGAFKLSTELEDKNNLLSDHKRIVFEPIYDADGLVFFDHNSQKYDKSDAQYCFVLYTCTKEEAQRLFGYVPVTVQNIITQGFYDTMQPIPQIYLAEYYTKETTKEMAHLYQDLLGQKFVITEEQIQENTYLEKKLKLFGYEKKKSKKIMREKVRKYIISGDKILDDCGYVPGGVIPVVPVYATRTIIGGIERYSGHVRPSIDVQRILNMELGILAEINNAPQIAKPILTAAQIVGQERHWGHDNQYQNAVLPINDLQDSQGNIIPTNIQYSQPPQLPPALAALLTISETYLKDVLGDKEQLEKSIANVSGHALDIINQRIDMQNFQYIDNFAKSIKRSGQIWLQMAKEVYGDPLRAIASYTEDKKTKFIDLGQMSDHQADPLSSTGSILYNADMNVFVDVGPTTSSRKSSTLRSISMLMGMTNDPEVSSILQSLAVMNLDAEGVTDVQEYFRKKLVAIGVMAPNEQEKRELEQSQKNQKPDPNAELIKAATMETQARALKAEADTKLTMAKTEESYAKIAQMAADMDSKQKKMLLEILSAHQQEDMATQNAQRPQ